MLAIVCAACGLTVVGSVDSSGADDGGVPRRDAETPTRDPRADASESKPEDAAAEDGGDVDAGPPPLVARLNINGPTHQGVDHPGVWTASPVPGGACGPSAYTSPRPLVGMNDAPMFAGEAFGNPLACTVGSALASGRYRVVLHFAEVYFGLGCPGGGGVGSRVFDVYLEDQKVLSKLDVYAESGGCLVSIGGNVGAPIVRSFEVDILDGKLDIRMPASANNAKLSALELFGPL